MQTFQTRIDKLSKEYDAFYPKLNDCKLWYRLLNKEIFDNRLTKKASFDIRKRREHWAYFDIDNDQYLMHNKYKSKKQFVEVLGHEMVHHWQKENDDPVSHGPSFYIWNTLFEAYNLNLKRIM